MAVAPRRGVGVTSLPLRRGKLAAFILPHGGFMRAFVRPWRAGVLVAVPALALLGAAGGGARGAARVPSPGAPGPGGYAAGSRHWSTTARTGRGRGRRASGVRPGRAALP